MAERRMFAKTIICSDLFLEMPLSAQALYFHLGLNAYDDGSTRNIKAICRALQVSDIDIDILIRKGFLKKSIIKGEYIITDWDINNEL